MPETDEATARSAAANAEILRQLWHTTMKKGVTVNGLGIGAVRATGSRVTVTLEDGTVMRFDALAEG